MDKITESLKNYLDAAGIPHQTIFNSGGGLKKQYPTSTASYRENKDNPRQHTLLIVNIYPEDNEFRIISSPATAFLDFELDKLHVFETKWNRGGGLIRTSLVIEESELFGPCQLRIFGFCDSNGLSDAMWEKYIGRIENETWEALDEIKELLGIDDVDEEQPNEPAVSDDLPF